MVFSFTVLAISVVLVAATCGLVAETGSNSAADLLGSVDIQCSPWYLPQEINGSTVCTSHCGDHLNGVVKCYSSSFRTDLMSTFCMSFSQDRSKLVVGACPYTYAFAEKGNTYYTLPKNATELSEYVCGRLNREGQLCGRCKKGYALPVYSYNLACIECTDKHSGTMSWLKYVTMSFAPLTVFYAVVLTFRISANSGTMNGFVIIAQTLSIPTLLRSQILQDRMNVHLLYLPLSLDRFWAYGTWTSSDSSTSPFVSPT